jgi:glycosyltransferase involved in cell wall biosynthesis
LATIGIDVTAFSTSASGGIGVSQYQIMRALASSGSEHDFIMYTATPPVVPFTDVPLDIPWRLRLGSGLTSRSNILWMQTGVNALLKADAVDLFWGPRHLLPFRAKGVARVATVHDFWHHHFPEQQPWLNRVANSFLIKRVLTVADRVVVPSGATAADAVLLGGIGGDKVEVVPMGVDASVFSRCEDDGIAAALRRLGVETPYFLSMDVFNPRKGFGAVLEAFAGLPTNLRENASLVGLGRERPTAGNASPSERASELGIADRVRIIGDVALADLVALYSGASAFVYPSVYEGFGMPVLEAMACGCPVISANSSSIPEVAGEAAILVDPESPAALRDAMRTVMEQEPVRERLIRDGLDRARQFSWENTARGMLGVFDRVLADRSRSGIRS